MTLPLDLDLATNPEPRCACVLQLDTSGSMHGEPIDALNQGLKAFEADIQGDDLAKKRVELAVVTFGGSVQRVQEFVTAGHFTAPPLSAYGQTPMGEAISTAVQMVRDRTATYKTNGVRHYRPWIFMITDGLPTDPPDVFQNAAALVKAEASKLLFFAVGVRGADMQVLRYLTERAVQLDGLKFRELFQWLSASQKRVSASKVGEQTSLPDVGGFAAQV